MGEKQAYENRKQYQQLNGQLPRPQRDTLNLNDAVIRELQENEEGVVWKLHDYSTTGDDGKTLVFFKNLEDHLIDFIQEADVILGCIAWVTSEPILKALSQKKGVSIIVQKEDFLRPDLLPQNDWSRRLRHLYDSLPKKLDRRDLPGPLPFLANTTLIEPVRCVGIANLEKQSACPRSHHKFVIMCKAIERCMCNECHEKESFEREFLGDLMYKNNLIHLHPYAVWTGSFNFTKNAAFSFENAVVLHDANIINAFLNEYAQVAVLSEPLDWTMPYMQRDRHIEMPYT